MDFSIIVLLLVCVANLSLGLFVLVRDPKSLVTRSFFSITIFISAWAVCNYLTENANSLNLNTFFNRLAYPAGFLAITSTVLFTKNFTSQSVKSGHRHLLLIFFSLCFSIFSATNFVTGYVAKDNGELIFTAGSLIGVYIAAIVLMVSIIIRDFYHAIRYGTQTQKSQAWIIMVSLVFSISIGTVLNAVIPAIFENFNSAKFGPSILSLFLVSTISYAIVKHKVFDIKLVVARSFAYVLSLATMASLFIFATVAATSVFFADISDATARLLYTVLAVGLAVIFPSLRKFFDKTTNHLFYRDAYDAQAFLDDLNKVLVSTYELKPLLDKSAKIIEDNIKPAFCYFSVRESDGRFKKLIGVTDRRHINHDEILLTVREAAPHMRDTVIVTDLLSGKEAKAYDQLKAKDVSVVAKLNPSRLNRGASVGYLILGLKKSGNLYSSNDVRAIDIVANELAIAIQNALRFEEIEHFNLTLQAKVDEATKKLRRANEKLRELDETKDDFISMASHQLRTPLTSVKGYISMVLEGDGGKITHMQREMLGQAFFSSQRMVYLIADLLNVSRLKTGKFIIEPTPVNLADVVEQELGQLEETAASRSLKLTYDKPKNFPAIMLDETKTRQVIMNFVDNAIYYTPANGNIDVQLSDNNTTVELRVVDDGMGVPKSEQPHLFTKFYRAGNARKARPDGTGLGLFMAKKVIVAQGGSLIFESQEGKGSTFGFTFSKHKLAADTKKPAPQEGPAKATIKA